jgi:serine/threonine-protein kinase
MVASLPLRPGTVLGGRYEIDELLARGGHGALFRAKQRPIGREVAIKVMLPSAAPDAAQRFGREVALVQKLEHPNTVRLYDFGTTDDGRPYMVFELLRGRSLEAVIAEGAMSAERVAPIAAQILKSLMEAHGLGIVHRDVKPSNVMLVSYSGEEDFVKVLDFGVARPIEASVKGKSITREGQLVGSAPYMSPEAVRGERLDARADLYALGVVMAEALSGAPIYDGLSEVHIWMKHASAEPAPIPPRVLASPLGPVIARAVQKDRNERYASSADMLADVERVAAALAGDDPAPTARMLVAEVGPEQ